MAVQRNHIAAIGDEALADDSSTCSSFDGLVSVWESPTQKESLIASVKMFLTDLLIVMLVIHYPNRIYNFYGTWVLQSLAMY